MPNSVLVVGSRMQARTYSLSIRNLQTQCRSLRERRAMLAGRHRAVGLERVLRGLLEAHSAQDRYSSVQALAMMEVKIVTICRAVATSWH